MKEFLKNPLLSSLFGVSLILNVANLAIVFFFIRGFKKSIILHYNAYLGVDLIGSSLQALLIPVVGLFFLAINYILSYYFFSKKERIISHILSLATLIVQLTLVIASATLILINY